MGYSLDEMSYLSAESKAFLRDRKLDMISIVIPVYNVETYVQQCVESILQQTYTYLEILLINDGSTDQSGAICQEIAARDERVKVFHKSNGGLSEARNLGIENANGRYISFIDGDDFVEAMYIERLYVEALRHDVAIAVSDYNRLNESEGVFLFHTGQAYTRSMAVEEYFDEIFKTETLAFVVAWGKLIRTDLFQGNHPIRFPVGRVAEDKYVTYLLAWKAQKVVYIHEPNYCYRQRPGSITASQFSIQRAADDIEGCEQRMLDLILMGYDLTGPLGWYQYILQIHQREMERAGLVHTALYQKVAKKLALIKQEYR